MTLSTARRSLLARFAPRLAAEGITIGTVRLESGDLAACARALTS
jgi:hypothetical protein